MTIQLTIDDSKYYAAPWTVTQEHPLMADDELLKTVCLENEKDVDHLVGK
jgi:hypothetical protein